MQTPQRMKNGCFEMRYGHDVAVIEKRSTCFLRWRYGMAYLVWGKDERFCWSVWAASLLLYICVATVSLEIQE